MRTPAHNPLSLLLLLVSTFPLSAYSYMLGRSVTATFQRMSASSTRCFSIAPDSIVKFSYDVGAKASEELLCPVGSASAVYPYALETGGYFPSLFESLPPAGESVTVKDVQLAPSNPDMIANIPFDALSQSGLNLDELKIGQELFLQNGMKAAIVEKSDASIKIDANPPLSRLKDLTMEVSTEQILERTSPFEKTGTLSSWTTATWSDPKYETATFAGKLIFIAMLDILIKF